MRKLIEVASSLRKIASKKPDGRWKHHKSSEDSGGVYGEFWTFEGSLSDKYFYAVVAENDEGGFSLSSFIYKSKQDAVSHVKLFDPKNSLNALKEWHSDDKTLREAKYKVENLYNMSL